MTPADNPYLSLVVAARYDDHGGNFMRRMQAFLNSFIEQCRRHQLPAEVIIVEWNPLPDRCGLAQALEWPEGDAMAWCQVRVITVPPEIHARYEHGAKIPLYQMIAKNAAIRRARGEWVLATNIDIFFNDALMNFLAQRKLERGKMYRMDRHDAGEDFPLWASAAQQLAYCEGNLLRVFAREGTFALDDHGRRVVTGPDIVETDRITLGAGWYAPELHPVQPLRHVEDGAVIHIAALATPQTMVLRMEPGINAAGPIRVTLRGERGEVIRRHAVCRMGVLCVALPVSTTATELRLSVEAGWRPVVESMRTLLLRVWSVSLGVPPPKAPRRPPLTVSERAILWLRRRHRYLYAVLAPKFHLHDRFRKYHPLPPPVRLLNHARQPALLHTPACGDFTLLHRDAWNQLRGYAEFDAYSMHIDSLLCWAAHTAGFREEVLAEPMRIYHMEHGHGSGWTPEGSQALYDRIRASGLPWIEYSDYMAKALTMNDSSAPTIFNADNWGLAGDTLNESGPDCSEAASQLRWCHADPDSPSRRRALHQ